jgi:hypothetical protein
MSIKGQVLIKWRQGNNAVCLYPGSSHVKQNQARTLLGLAEGDDLGDWERVAIALESATWDC